MKAIQVKHPGGPEAMELVELPVPEPKASEAVVKLAASGVNFIDVYNREGRYKVPLPFVLGQEGAGTVTAVGADVKSVKPGDRVAWTSVLGSYGEYAAIPADRLVPIPAGVSDQQAAAAMLQGLTAQYLTHDTYPLKRAETALVHAAAGGVGLLLTQMAHDIRARVIATVSTDETPNAARGRPPSRGAPGAAALPLCPPSVPAAGPTHRAWARRARVGPDLRIADERRRHVRAAFELPPGGPRPTTSSRCPNRSRRDGCR